MLLLLKIISSILQFLAIFLKIVNIFINMLSVISLGDILESGIPNQKISVHFVRISIHFAQFFQKINLHSCQQIVIFFSIVYAYLLQIYIQLYHHWFTSFYFLIC